MGQITIEQINRWLSTRENEHLEFKTARRHFDFDELTKYSAALANERGGHIVFGVTPELPRRVVGTAAFDDLERTVHGVTDRLRLKIEAERVPHPDGFVVVFRIPSRPLGMPIGLNGAFWMRAGESLTAMTVDQLRRILDEIGPDFSAEHCNRASLEDLDVRAVLRFRQLWRRKSANAALDNLTDEQLLTDAELLIDGAPTYAALVLLGTGPALGRHLAAAEVIFEYRSSESSIPYQQRREFREGFLLFDDELWKLVNLRNEQHEFREGLFVGSIPTWNEWVVREAILNAVCHREYRLAGSVFVRQFPATLEIVSPGGLPAGITVENLLYRQAPRNRRIADSLSRCGLVERSGQGANRMYEFSLKEGKQRPDFAGTDEHQVSVTLRGSVRNPRFLVLLESLAQERNEQLSLEDLLLLDAVVSGERAPDSLRARAGAMVDQGVFERIGRGRGSKLVLARRWYRVLGEPGTYTRRRGLDREASKALVVAHIRGEPGCTFAELRRVVPHLSDDQLKDILRELRTARVLHTVGRTRAARWHSGPGDSPQSEGRSR